MKTQRRDLCPAPDCGKPVDTKHVLHDGRERPWHHDCAVRTLADHFRTPLDLKALDGERVEFKIPGEHAEIHRTGDIATVTFRSPRDFVLRAVRFGGDFGLYAMFVGCTNMLMTAPTFENTIFGDDLKGRLLSLDEVVDTGIDITCQLSFRDTDNIHAVRLTLIGELFDPETRRRTHHRDAARLAVGGLYSHDLVESGASVKLMTGIYCPTHFERLVADDHEGWIVERVKICCFAGDLMSELAAGNDGLVDVRTVHTESRRLVGRVTPLPTFVAKPGETVAVFMRNEGPPRKFAGRLLGAGTWK